MYSTLALPPPPLGMLFSHLPFEQFVFRTQITGHFVEFISALVLSKNYLTSGKMSWQTSSKDNSSRDISSSWTFRLQITNFITFRRIFSAHILSKNYFTSSKISWQTSSKDNSSQDISSSWTFRLQNTNFCTFCQIFPLIFCPKNYLISSKMSWQASSEDNSSRDNWSLFAKSFSSMYCIIIICNSFHSYFIEWNL